MKSKFFSKITILLVLFCLLFSQASINTLTTLGEEKSNLAMNKNIGISEDIGTFRCINAPIMTNLNFYKQGMAFDSKGNLYITDSGESQIEVFDSNLKPLRHFGGIGNKPAQFQYLVDLTISQDEIFALDLTLGRVQVFDLEGNILYQFSTKVESDKASSHPIGLAISLDTNIFVIDLFNGIKVFKRDGTFVRLLEWSIDFIYRGRFPSYEPIMIEDIKSDASGNIYVLSTIPEDGSPMIIIANPEGELLGNDLYESVILLSQYLTPNGGFAMEGDTLYAFLWYPSTSADSTVYCFSGKYNLSPCSFEIEKFIFGNPETDTENIPLMEPTSFIIRSQILYFLDSFTNTIYQIDQHGKLLKSYTSPKSDLIMLNGVCGDDLGNIYITSASKNLISVYNENLEMISTLGKPAIFGNIPEIGEFSLPYGATVDSKNYLYVTDLYTPCIQVFDPQRNPYFTILLENRSIFLTGITIDEQGNLVVKDSQEHRIYVFDISQIESKKVVQTNTIKTGIDDVAYNNGAYNDIEFTSLVTNQKNNFLIPLREDRILVEMDQKGKTVKSYHNSGNPETFYEVVSPRHIIKDQNQNFIMVDEWIGKIWKLDPDLKVIWEEKLPWFGIQSMWENDQGVIFVADKAHSVLFTMKDLTFVPSKNPNPPPLPPAPPTKAWVIKMKLGKTEFTINGKPAKLDAPPFRDPKNGRTFAPVRILVETIGGKIEWISKSQQVMIRKGELEIVLVINSPVAFVNGKKVPIDPINEESQSTKVVPKIVSGRVMLPLRFVSEQLGYLVEWIASSEEIILTYPKPVEEKPTEPEQPVDESVLQAWGKKYDISLSDYVIGTYPTKDNGLVVFIKTGEINKDSKEGWTAFLRLDKSGSIVQSKLINKQIDLTKKLSDGTFLLIGKKIINYYLFKEFTAIWMNESGEIIKSNDYILDSSMVSFYSFNKILQKNNDIYLYCEFDEKHEDKSNEDKYGFIKLEETLTVSILEDKWQNISDLGIVKITPIKSGIATISLRDFDGKAVWSKKLSFPDLIKKQKSGNDIYFSWQTFKDESMMISFFPNGDSKTCCFYYFDKMGLLKWGNSISFKNNFFRIDIGKMEIFDNLDTMVSIAGTTIGEDGSETIIGFLTFDKDGKVKRNIEMDPDLLAGNYEILNGYNQDYWLGCISPVFFHMPGYEDKIPCEIESTFRLKESKITMQITDNTTPEDIVLIPYDLNITSKSSTITTKPAKVYIKNLCQ
jgi:DNA-binding beta-propeller fold protein YncE